MTASYQGKASPYKANLGPRKLVALLKVLNALHLTRDWELSLQPPLHKPLSVHST